MKTRQHRLEQMGTARAQSAQLHDDIGHGLAVGMAASALLAVAAHNPTVLGGGVALGVAVGYLRNRRRGGQGDDPAPAHSMEDR